MNEMPILVEIRIYYSPFEFSIHFFQFTIIFHGQEINTKEVI